MSIPQSDIAIESPTDPRIQRTRLHVIAVAHELLNEGSAALTFSVVADRANVARQTLYKHWGTIENLIADTIVFVRNDWIDDYRDKNTEERAHLFLTRISTDIDKGMAAAISALLGASSHNAEAASAFKKLDMVLYQMFIASVGPVSHDQFFELASPIMLLTISRQPVSGEILSSLARRASQILD